MRSCRSQGPSWSCFLRPSHHHWAHLLGEGGQSWVSQSPPLPTPRRDGSRTALGSPPSPLLPFLVLPARYPTAPLPCPSLQRSQPPLFPVKAKVRYMWRDRRRSLGYAGDHMWVPVPPQLGKAPGPVQRGPVWSGGWMGVRAGKASCFGRPRGWRGRVSGHNEVVTRGEGMLGGGGHRNTHTHTCSRTHNRPDNRASVSGAAEPSELGV